MSADAPTPLDLDAIRQRATQGYPFLGLWAACNDALVLIHEVERLRAEVARPAACGRPNGYPARECTREYGHEGDHWHSEMHLAVVRDRQPVKPSREAVVQDVTTDVMDALGFHPHDAGRDDVAAVIRSHPDLLPGRSEAEVKAGALRGFAARQDSWCEAGRGGQIISREAMRDALIAEADRLAAEGGAP